MGARRVAGYVDASGITAEAGCMLIDPGQSGTNLLNHRQQITACLGDLREVDNDKMGAGIDDYLGRKREILGLTIAPCASMYIDIDRRVGPQRFVVSSFSISVGP